jgi:hypothetical protein
MPRLLNTLQIYNTTKAITTTTTKLIIIIIIIPLAKLEYLEMIIPN